MALLKKKTETVRVGFQAPVELAARLKNVESAVAAAGMTLDLDEQLTRALERLVKVAEKELQPAQAAPAASK